MGPRPCRCRSPRAATGSAGAADALRVPSFRATSRPRTGRWCSTSRLAESLRVNAGPGLALAPRAARVRDRPGGRVARRRPARRRRAGSTEGGAQFLLGSIYDVRRGALLREGSVRMVAGSVPAVNLGALASFLLTGQSSRDVKDRTREAPRELPAARRRDARRRRAPADRAPRGARRGAAPGGSGRSEPPPRQRGPASRRPGTRHGACERPQHGAGGAPPAPPAPPPAAPRRSRSPRRPAEPRRARSRRIDARPWMRPTAIGSGVAAVVLAVLRRPAGRSSASAAPRATRTRWSARTACSGGRRIQRATAALRGDARRHAAQRVPLRRVSPRRSRPPPACSAGCPGIARASRRARGSILTPVPPGSRRRALPALDTRGPSA